METTTKEVTPLHAKHSFGELAEMLLEIRKIISQYPEPMRYPEKKRAYTVKEWNEHVAEIEKVHEFNKELKESRDLSENQKYNIEQALFKIIPTAHVWFVTDDKKYAVAIQEDEWPSSPTEILIKTNPIIADLPELKIRKANFN